LKKQILSMVIKNGDKTSGKAEINDHIKTAEKKAVA
jgi:hypothetical protein